MEWYIKYDEFKLSKNYDFTLFGKYKWLNNKYKVFLKDLEIYL